MKKKRYLILLCALIVVVLAVAFSACNKKGEFVDVGIELNYAKQYYVEGESFTPEGGSLIVYSYNENTKESKRRYVDLTDKDVTLENTAGARIDTYTVTARYKGLSTRFKYIVQKKDGAVKDVIFKIGDDETVPKYSVSNIRSSIDYQDFIGMKFVIKYRDEKKADVDVPLSDADSYRFYPLSYSGFDVKTAGQKDIVFTLYATDARLPYEVKEKDFIYKYEFVKRNANKEFIKTEGKINTLKTTYLVGEEFDAQNTWIKYTYKSLKEAEPVEITKADIKGLDTSRPGKNNTFVLSTLAGIETFRYTVYERTEVKIKDLKFNTFDFFVATPIMVDKLVWTEKTKDEWLDYEEYINSIKLALVMDDKYVPVTGASEDIDLYYIKTGEDLTLKKVFDESAYDTIKKSVGVFEIIAVYNKAEGIYLRGLQISTKDFITGIDFENLQYEGLVFNKGDSFSFGEATAVVHYAVKDDVRVKLQEEYKKGTNDLRVIKFYKRKPNVEEEAKTFDMGVGEHTKYFIGISDCVVTINGEPYAKDIGKIYIKYTVKEA